jgi:hypothetical protein
MKGACHLFRDHDQSRARPAWASALEVGAKLAATAAIHKDREGKHNRPWGQTSGLDRCRALPHVEVLPALLVREGAGDAVAGKVTEVVDRKKMQGNRPVGAPGR